MRLALFDIDGTLIRCDSEFRWCEFLTRNGLFDMSDIDRYCADYEAGQLDFEEFARFQLAPLAALDQDLLFDQRERFLREDIAPEICELLQQRIQVHRQRGDQVVSISAAHSFLADPIARMTGIEQNLCTIAAHDGQRFTGEVQGEPCFQEGKLVHIDNWLESQGMSWDQLEASWFYSDSHNDLPLLRRAETAIAVRPDKVLTRIAAELGWELIE
ncbi:MAG: HAD superfamily hydrolase (TIGR01490 family) [Candidatus Paceibacteria bacterium]|jgi:HAD superfamily hydrolase (TIGR01490 family)